MDKLGFGLEFSHLYNGLEKVDKAFVASLEPSLAKRLGDARKGKAEDESQLMIDLAESLDSFIAKLFSVEGELRSLTERHQPALLINRIKTDFIRRTVAKQYKQAPADFDPALLDELMGKGWDEESYARKVDSWQKQISAQKASAQNTPAQNIPEQSTSNQATPAQANQDQAAPEQTNPEQTASTQSASEQTNPERTASAQVAQSALNQAAKYAAWAMHSEEGKKRHSGGSLFTTPSKIDPLQLVPLQSHSDGEQEGTHPFASPHGEITPSEPTQEDTSNPTSSQYLTSPHHKPRNGFGLTDNGMSLNQALAEAHYCIFCHSRHKDSCAKGFKDLGEEFGFRKDSFGKSLTGCPLEEKISEMNFLKSKGIAVAALAVAVVDNPMIAGTGHRICNDCMKACIYQKQQPVDIPQVETRTLKDVLELPYGFEIYSLLVKWNPMNFARPFALPATGKNVLVVGLGPAGYTLAHHLLNEGHSVVAIDGLKLEPLPPKLVGITKDKQPCAFEPIKDYSSITEPLDTRINAGFGGVAEYGITSRWDKNYLKIIRLLLERRRAFRAYGGIRLGGELSIQDAFSLGFDHIALALGAGRPRVLSIPNGLANGMRQASDFLMALQLTGAAKNQSIANLQLRLPTVVIGGGLTAIDTATEARAYYPVQVKKFRSRYLGLVAKFGAEKVRQNWSAEEIQIAEEFLAHGEAIAKAEAQSDSAKRVSQLLDKWGGVAIAYRRRLIDSPAYRLNHEEVELAMAEGLKFYENLSPKEIKVDEFGSTRAIEFETKNAAAEPNPEGTTEGKTEGNTEGNAEGTTEGSAEGGAQAVSLKARSILVAAGTYPNTVLARESEGLKADDSGFAAINEANKQVRPQPVPKPTEDFFLTQLREDNRAISFFGDLHPSYAGNVVSAMASAKNGYPHISRLLSKVEAKTEFSNLVAKLNGLLCPRVEEIKRLAPKIIEVIIKAPAAAKKFKPGQFFRLQNYETYAPLLSNNSSEETAGKGLGGAEVMGNGGATNGTTNGATNGHPQQAINPDPQEATNGATNGATNQTTNGATRLAMEGLAMTGAWVDPAKGLVSVIALEMGGSSDVCKHLKKGEQVVLMGPTGSPTQIPQGETVLLVGGGLGNAVLFSIGKAMRERGNKVLYFAAYRQTEDIYKQKQIEQAADVVVWCCEQELPKASRAQDLAFKGNVVEAMEHYHSQSTNQKNPPTGEQANPSWQTPIPFGDVNRILTIGSDGMMAAVTKARQWLFKNQPHVAIGSINSPMQCMMKEICAQCLQRHVNEKGEEKIVYSCYNQDQPLDAVDFECLKHRLRQNAVGEMLTASWLEYLNV